MMNKKHVVAAIIAMLIASPAVSQEITKAEVVEAQKVWGDGIVAIGDTFTDGGDYKSKAADLVDELYAYEKGSVLFKPTRASEEQFRLTKDEATSYFVTGVVKEDHGFAIQPWSAVRFENAGIIIEEDSAIAMGNYYFTDAKTGREAKAEYTFGYERGSDGKLEIMVHHSSFPYNPKE